MQFLRKYLLLLFILENLMAQFRPLMAISAVLFYVILGLSLAVFFTESTHFKQFYKAFPFFYYLSLIILSYELCFGFNAISDRNLMYALSKIVSMMVIVLSVFYNFRFYFKDFLRPLGYIISLMLIYGVLTDSISFENEDLSRLYLGFGNQNSTSEVGFIGFACVLFSYKRLNVIDVLCFLICLYGTFAGGSRNSILMCFIVIIIRFGFSFKVIIAILLGYVAIVDILPSLGLRTVGLQRFIDTINGEMSNNRDLERKAAWMMIKQRPWTGWGFDAPNIGAAAKISELGSHSTIIQLIKYLGYVFASFWFVAIIKSVYDVWFLLKRGNTYLKFHFAMVISILIAMLNEEYLIGIHEITTTMFFVSLGVLTNSSYLLKKRLSNENKSSIHN